MLQTIKKRNLSILLILFALTMLFVNCQFDDKESFHINNYNHSTYKVQKLKKEQYVKNSKLVNRLNKFESKFAKKSNSKIVSANDNSFSIDTDYSLFIEKENGKHSYTFLINRENSPYLLENLILSSHDSLGYEVYIAQYDITPSEYEQIKNGQTPNLLSKISLVKVENAINIQNIFNRSAGFRTQGLCGSWETIPANNCNGPGLHTYENKEECSAWRQGRVELHPDITIYVWEECGYDSSGGGSGGSNGGSTGGSTGGGSDGSDGGSTTDNPTGQDKDDSIITTPVTPPIKEVKNPCSELKKISASPNYEDRIGFLKMKAAGEKEHAWIYKLFPNTNSFAPPTVVGHNTTNPNVVDFSGFEGFEWIGAFHNHTSSGKETIKMFSAEDLLWLFNKANIRYRHNLINNLPQGNFSDLFFGLVNVNEVYCIKIKDVEKFRNSMIAKFKKIEEELTNKYIASHQSGSSQISLQKDFLKILKDYNIGVGLYQERSTGEWIELQLDTQNENNNPSSLPCN